MFVEVVVVVTIPTLLPVAGVVVEGLTAQAVVMGCIMELLITEDGGGFPDDI
jgi:hypothetical protein